MLPLIAVVLSLAAGILAADQSPPTAFALTQQYRPTTAFQSCKMTGDIKTNCGFCYSKSGSFQGWNCNCDKFCTGTANDCYYILESDPNNYARVTCQAASVGTGELGNSTSVQRRPRRGRAQSTAGNGGTFHLNHAPGVVATHSTACRAQ